MEAKIKHQILEYSILLISQVANAYLRSWNIRMISSGNRLLAHLSWQMYGIAFLVSLSLGIRSLVELDWIGIVIWFVGSGLGLEFSMRRKE